MKKRWLAVKDMVKITGITTRTLQYYDRIGLLKPAHVQENGYRLYDRSNLEQLQTILILKEMAFSLKEISEIMKLSKQEQKDILQEHTQALVAKKQKLEKVISTLNAYVDGTDVYRLQLFSDSSILPLQEQYAGEAKWLYGASDAYQAFEKKRESLTHQEQIERDAVFEQEMESIFKRVAAQMDTSPNSDEVQLLVKEWECHLTKLMPSDPHLLRCIAETYTSDQRFTNYINQFGEGDVATFMRQAILFYLE